MNLSQSMRTLWIRVLGETVMRGRAALLAILVSACFLLWASVGADATEEMGVVYVVKSDPSNPSIVFAAAQHGVFKSIDAGATWTATGLTVGTTALAVAPVTPTTVYAGNSSGLLKSTDGGTNWTSAGVSAPVCSVEVDPEIPTALYASTCSQILKSVDGGGNWSSVGPREGPLSSVAIAAGPPIVLYAVDGVEVSNSRDGGVTWSIPNNPDPDYLPLWGLSGLSLVVDPTTSTTVYVSYYGWSCDSTACFNTGAIVASSDGGATWSAVDRLLYYGSWVWPQISVSPVAVDPLTADIYSTWSVSCDQFDPFCAGYGIVEDHWVSKNAGGRVSDLAAYALWFDALRRNVLYASTGSGVLQSTDGGVTWTAVGGPGVTSLSVEPISVPGGGTSTGTVTLSAAAPAGGVVVTLSSTNTAVATVPGSVTVPPGSTTATFTVSTSPVMTSTTVPISATGEATVRFAQLLVTPTATLTSLSIQPTNVSAGSSASGTVTLNAAAPAGGVVVTLSSNNALAAAVPASVTVPAGATTVGFVVTTSAVTAPTTVTISATSGGVTRSAALTVTPPPPTLVSISLSPTSVQGGTSSTATITLSGAAPSGGVTVMLSSSNAAVAPVPASVTVPAGATTAGFSLSTNAVTSATVVTVSATSGGVTRSAALTVTPATALVSISLSPTTVKGGDRSTGTITLTSAAPLGGVTVTLSSSHPSIATVPSSATVPAGATGGQFTVSTSRPKSPTDVTISATLANVTKAATLTVRR